MYTGNRCGGGLNFYPNVYTLVREEVSASTRAWVRRHIYVHAHVRTHAYRYTARIQRHAEAHTNGQNGHVHTREFEGEFSHPSQSFSFSFRLSLSLFFLSFSLSVAREKESGKARIRSAVNLKINIDRGAANPLFIDADCWLHGRDAPRRLLPLPSLPLLPQHPLGFRCHVVPNAS